MKGSMQMFKLITEHKNFIKNVAHENGFDASLLTEDDLGTLIYQTNNVMLNVNKLETSEEKIGYLMTVVTLSIMAILRPEILDSKKD